jgi:hypothetical protein
LTAANIGFAGSVLVRLPSLAAREPEEALGMAPRLSDIWLRLYQLVEALEARASTPEGRVEAVTAELLTMPPELQQQSLARLEMLNQLAADLIALRR